MTVTSPTRLPYARVAILGAGLIGTSLAHAIRARDPECLISFADSNPDTITALGELFPTAWQALILPRRCAMPTW